MKKQEFKKQIDRITELYILNTNSVADGIYNTVDVLNLKALESIVLTFMLRHKPSTLRHIKKEEVMQFYSESLDLLLPSINEKIMKSINKVTEAKKKNKG